MDGAARAIRRGIHTISVLLIQITNYALLVALYFCVTSNNNAHQKPIHFAVFYENGWQNFYCHDCVVLCFVV